MKVRQPRIDLDARGRIATHGHQRPVRIVLHDTESHDYRGIRDLQGICNYWEHSTPGYGAHVIVDKEAKSALCASPKSICYHVADHNTGSVGIEMVGFARFTPKLWFARPRQLHKVARWLAYYNWKYGIPLQRDLNHGVTTHKAFGGSHWDPGYFFPFRYVLRLARRYRAEGWR